MVVSFKINCSVVFIFSNDMTSVILKEDKGNKLDGLFYTNKADEIQEVELVKLVNKETDLSLVPTDLRIVTTLQNIDKKWKIDIFMCVIDTIHKIKFTDELKLYKVDVLDSRCHPNLKWLIPLCTDLSVYGSAVNQILMK